MRILTLDSAADLVNAGMITVPLAVGCIPRLNSGAFASKLCNRRDFPRHHTAGVGGPATDRTAQATVATALAAPSGRHTGTTVLAAASCPRTPQKRSSPATTDEGGTTSPRQR